jgi:site-specific DNA-methyltransferase (adenine-specific)
VAIEDSGFELRDSIAWLYGSGFPKSLDVSKAIDKAAGAQREVIGSKMASPKGISGAESRSDTAAGAYGGEAKLIDITAPATDDAKKWAGWGTALKPAFEPVVVGRKPLVGTVAGNVLEWGVGGLNIDGSRIGTEERTNAGMSSLGVMHDDNWQPKEVSNTVQGRWPANIILDPFTAELLDEQSGVSVSKASSRGVGLNGSAVFGSGDAGFDSVRGMNDSGGASRFFYVAKASKRDRNEGLDDLEGKEIGAKGNGLARACATCGASVLDGCDCPDRTFVNPTRQNFHPTVKPTELMRYLIKLVTPAGGVVLDPFTGSGSTGKAALLDGYQFIGIEMTEEYLPIIEGRLNFALSNKMDKTTLF